MNKKDDYFEKMDSQIKKWDAEVDKLRANCTAPANRRGDIWRRASPHPPLLTAWT